MAVGSTIDHFVPAAEVVGSAGTGFKESSFIATQEESALTIEPEFLGLTNWLGFFVTDIFYRNSLCPFNNPFS